MTYYIGFVDAGYLKKAAARTLKVDPNQLRLVAGAVVDWFTQLYTVIPSEQFLRLYWYDGQHDPRHPGYTAQRGFFDAIASTPGIQLRAGHLVERVPKWQAPIKYALKASAQSFGLDPDAFLADFESRFRFIPDREQKGVDTLITLDLVNLGQGGAYQSAVLISGDRDLAEAVRTAQAMGRRVVIAHPEGDGIATELRQLADLVQAISTSDVAKMFEQRSGTPAGRSAGELVVRPKPLATSPARSS